VARFLENRQLDGCGRVVSELAQTSLQFIATDAFAMQRLLYHLAIADQHPRLAANQMADPGRMRAPRRKASMHGKHRNDKYDRIGPSVIERSALNDYA
jgi:hypothetical protein